MCIFTNRNWAGWLFKVKNKVHKQSQDKSGQQRNVELWVSESLPSDFCQSQVSQFLYDFCHSSYFSYLGLSASRAERLLGWFYPQVRVLLPALQFWICPQKFVWCHSSLHGLHDLHVSWLFRPPWWHVGLWGCTKVCHGILECGIRQSSGNM